MVKHGEPTAEDIKCELQLNALSAMEPKWEIDLGWFKEIKAYDDNNANAEKV